MAEFGQLIFLLMTIAYQFISRILEDRTTKPPGKLIELNGRKIHCWWQGKCNSINSPTIVLDHSLGGLDGYFLIEELSKLSRVFIYDRPGYGWSQPSPNPRTSQQIVNDLDALLTIAQIEPPYLLIGDSFGSYNMRLYAHQFPQKVVGLVLTDGLHEDLMLKMPLFLNFVKIFLTLSFGLAQLGAFLGIVRICGTIGLFHLLKPTLRNFSTATLKPVMRSFYRSNHWVAMCREMLSLNTSSRQLRSAQNFGNLAIVNIQAKHFLRPSVGLFSFLIPFADRLRDQMQSKLSKLSTNVSQLSADQSSHFVWVDQPQVIVQAVQQLLHKVSNQV
ncbi:alpha/beta fold hydrolase [Phormidesmis priestleyi]